MRKADYSALAAIIRTAVAIGRAGAAVEHQTAESRAECRATFETARNIAERFASRASVDRAAFLRACGIEP